MSLEQWIISVTPTEFGASLLLWSGLVAGCLFLWKKVWPWFTDVYFPARQKERQTDKENEAASERERNGMLGAIRDALIELKVVAGQQLLLMQKHDVDAVARTNLLIQGQQNLADMLDRLGVIRGDKGPTNAGSD